MAKSENYQKIKKFCLSWGADLFGAADIASLKGTFVITPKIVEGLDKALSLGVRTSCEVLGEIEQQPTKLYFHHYRTINMFLDQLALRLSNYIQNLGFKSLPIPASQILDWQKQTAHLSHKKIGLLAGLGWLGRNNLLVNKNLGSQFRLVTILTNMPLKSDKPLENDCGDCRLCVTICPSGSIKKNPLEFDHLACFEKLKEFQRQKLVDQYICGVCINI